VKGLRRSDSRDGFGGYGVVDQDGVIVVHRMFHRRIGNQIIRRTRQVNFKLFAAWQDII
jgi:hypothetical protein